MKHIYKIETCAFGTFWVQDVNAPLYWIGSGCYDVEYECYQEATFDVAADSLNDALKMIYDSFEKLNTQYDYNLYSVYYDPNTVEEKDDEDDGNAEVFDYNFSEPVNGESVEIPERFSKEIGDESK